jgi:hypothetical protein
MVLVETVEVFNVIHILQNKGILHQLIIKTCKKYFCIPRSFLVINVCNQGKILCSLCITPRLGSEQSLPFPSLVKLPSTLSQVMM